MPTAIPKLDVAHLGQMETLPLASGRKAALAATGELIDKRDFLPVAMADDDWAELPAVSVVDAKDLLALRHGAREQRVCEARHGIPHSLGWQCNYLRAFVIKNAALTQKLHGGYVHDMF